MLHKTTLFVTFLLASAGTAIFAQETKKGSVPSPPADTSVTIDGKKIGIEYAAPSMRERKIFGGLVPYGQVWRTGANAATTLKTEADLDINGLQVPKGEYTLYTLPSQNGMMLIVNKQTGQWGTEYSQGQDLGRVKMTMSRPPAPIETFKITLTGDGGKKGKLTMAWENTAASVPFTVK
ncbi:MAG: DUF2911 domain-containing protein [Acidobacteriota bacterium]|nr:DUF2911 domain-containing protein [Acidobacteriota bacterium]